MEDKVLKLIEEMRVAYQRYRKTNSAIGDYQKALEFQVKDEVLGLLWGYIITNKIDSMLDYFTRENDKFRGKK